METVTCNHCHAEIPATTEIYCPECTQQFAAPPAPGPAPPSAAQPTPPPRPAAEKAAGVEVQVGLVFPWGFQSVGRGEALIVGREHPPLAEQLTAYPNVSRGHARLEHRDGALYVTDLGSRNGTRVDGRRIDAESAQPLASGQELRFSATLAATVVAPPGSPQ